MRDTFVSDFDNLSNRETWEQTTILSMNYDMNFIYSKAVLMALEELEASRMKLETPRYSPRKENIIDWAEIPALPEIYQSLPGSVRMRIEQQLLATDEEEDANVFKLNLKNKKLALSRSNSVNQKSGSLPKIKASARSSNSKQSSRGGSSTKLPALLTQTKFSARGTKAVK